MKILHISDIHMEAESQTSFIDSITEAFNNSSEDGLDLLPDIMLVTGDFTNKGLPREFEKAKEAMQKIKENITTINDCLIVPGNHDFLWNEDGKTVPIDERYINYRNFKNNCERDKICRSVSSELPETIEESLEKYLITHLFVKQKTYALLIIGMNSVVLDSEERAGQGYFGKRQHNICQKLIKYYKVKCKGENIPLIIMTAFHHHVLPVSSVERDTINRPDKFSLTLDARRTLNFLMDNEVRFAVHGHQHQPSIVCWKDEMRRLGDSVYVISAGSMTQNREDLGDVSKNSFMVYDVDENKAKVYCFQNSENDWDVMELSHEPYTLLLQDPYADIKCKVSENAHPPKDIVIADYCCDKDTSDLFYLFLNVVDCNQAHKEILNYFNQYIESTKKIELCGVHHLYGKYDLLLKYRDRAEDGDLFFKKIKSHLKRTKNMNPNAGFYFMNVSYENKNFKEIQSIPLFKSPEAYLNSTWNMATLTVYLERHLSVEQFIQSLNDSISIFNSKNNTKIEDIIRNYSVGQDQSMIFELFISCYQFPMLTRFTNLIEDIIRDYGIDKSTHIMYYIDERCL